MTLAELLKSLAEMHGGVSALCRTVGIESVAWYKGRQLGRLSQVVRDRLQVRQVTPGVWEFYGQTPARAKYKQAPGTGWCIGCAAAQDAELCEALPDGCIEKEIIWVPR